VFLPLNFIASVGGMSEFTLFTQHIPWWVSYSIFTGAMLLLAIFTYVFVSKMGYENRLRRERKKITKKPGA
jgi:magnesium transporter